MSFAWDVAASASPTSGTLPPGGTPFGSVRHPLSRIPRQAAPPELRHWPERLRPAALAELVTPTPFLAVDTALVRDRVAAFAAAFSGAVAIRFAVKCNPLPGVLSSVVAAGGSFEIASAAELDLALAAGARAGDIFYSNPVKPADHVARTFAAGVRRFVADGPAEIDKIAANAPGASVLIRVRVDDAASAFPLSGKFGIHAGTAGPLLEYAALQGLDPAGVTFHVGSQCTDPDAWARAIRSLVPLFEERARSGRPIRILDIGGGFPARYADPVPELGTIAAATVAALDELPYRPDEIVAEPGRSLVAEAGVIGARVIGREDRDGRPWIYLDVGAYNGLMEAAQTDGTWRYPVLAVHGDSGERLALTTRIRATVTGPTCDSSDTVLRDVELPADLAVGDRLLIGGAGAYSLCYASSFNGFPPPQPLLLP